MEDRPKICLTFSGPLLQDAFPLHDLQRIAFDNVPRGAQLYLYRPDPGWRNPSDCVDMDCDGALHIMIKDLDGSFMGVPGGSIVGHYDVPRAPIQQGTAVYSPQCVLNTVWAGYECQPFNQRMVSSQRFCKLLSTSAIALEMYKDRSPLTSRAYAPGSFGPTVAPYLLLLLCMSWV